VNRALVACVVISCTQTTTTSSVDPVLTGDICAIYATAAACGSGCTWTGSACAGSGSAAACTCPDDGAAVCVAENGQPLTCVMPTAGTGDPCVRIAGVTCDASSTIAGLCVCE
jgi:hypothetical protein